MRPLLLVLALGACSDDVERPNTGNAGQHDVAPSTLPAIAREPDVRLRVISPGREPRRALRFAATRGARHTLTFEIMSSLDLRSGPHPMLAQEGVTSGIIDLTVERATAGEIALELVVRELELVPWGPAPKPADFTGARGSVVVSDRGELIAADLPFREEVDDVSGGFEIADWVVRLPDEPVGIDASWELESTIVRGGISMDVIERHTLVELDGNGGRTRYVQEHRVAPQLINAFSTEPISMLEATGGSGTVAGEVSFALDRPFPASTSVSFELAYGMKIRAPAASHDISTTTKLRYQASSH